MREILIATGNKGKLLEMQELLVGLPLRLVLPAELGITLEVEENGATYADNAALKALAYCRAAGMLALADDSGLEVDVLGGLPGIRSARFSEKPGASDADRRAYLLKRLQRFPRPWRAHFHCTVALAKPGTELLFAEGDCPGEIIPVERGDNGFGYDPIFLLTELGLTMAELDMQTKNRLSHRARAMLAARPLLIDLIKA